jgi:tetratricopeptide (TPR) repeat protein
LPFGEALAIHLALHTGQAVIGQRDADPHATAMVVGNPMTLAIALARQAAPDTILASTMTLRLVHGEVRTARSRSLHVNEYPTPVPVAEVLQTIPQQQLPVGLAGRARSPFVGRDTELAILHTRLVRAEQGQGQVVGVLGEPGIGKSRLLAEFRHSIRSRTVTYLQGYCHSYGSTIPYLPLLDLWRRAWDIGEADSAAVMTAKVQIGLQALGLEPDAWTPSLLPLLDIETASEQSARMSPDEQKTRTFETLHQLCLASSRQQPCVMAIENLHWIDATSDAYLETLVERLVGAPILLLVSFRPGYRTPWLDKSYATQLALQPLEQQESRRVLRAVRHDAPLSVVLEQHLLTKAEGNPFFLEELAQTVVENAGDSPTLVMPDTVQAVLAARIDRLPPTEKQLLQIAAVIGAEVPSPLLHALAGVSEGALQHPLAHLQAVELLYETRMASECTYVFKHVLTHEVAYSSLLQEQRRTLHQRIVVALETLYTHHLAEQSDRLAYHALHGEAWDKAWHYFWQAGTRAMARSAHREAMLCFEQALAAARHLPEDHARHAQYIDLCFDLRNALLPLGEHTRILAILHEAEPLAESLDDARRLGWLSCYMSTQGFILGEYDHAIGSGQRALALATTCEDLALQVTTHLRLGQVYHALGNYRQAIEALRWNVVSLAGELLQERFGLAGLPSVHSRTWLGWCLAEMGAFPEGIAYGAEGLRVAEAVERPYDLLVAYCGLGQVYLHQGDLASALPMLERGLSLCQRTHIPLLLSTIASLLGTAYALCGRISEALPLLEQAVAQDTARRLPASSSIAGVRLSQAYLLAGRVQEAQQLARQMLDLARTRKEQGHEAHALWLLGEIYIQDLPQQVELAATCYRQALALAEALAMRPLLAHCHLGLGLLYSQGPGGAQARTELSAAIELFQSMDMRLWLPRAEAALAQVV